MNRLEKAQLAVKETGLAYANSLINLFNSQHTIEKTQAGCIKAGQRYIKTPEYIKFSRAKDNYANAVNGLKTMLFNAELLSDTKVLTESTEMRRKLNEHLFKKAIGEIKNAFK